MAKRTSIIGGSGGGMSRGSLFRFVCGLGLCAAAATASPACSSGDDFTTKSTGGAGGAGTGGGAGDASTTGGAGGTAGTGGGGGVAGNPFTGGAGGIAGAGGVSGEGGTSGSGGSGGTGGNTSGKDDGQPCSDKTECKSNYCVDDVCCESACAGACQSCKISGKEGLCTPYAAKSDPEGECIGAGTPTDPCAGTCDGKSACDYPDPTKACGTATCTNATASTFACDSAGACKKTDKGCGVYQCSGANCLTSCSQDIECVAGNYCENPTCTAKLSLGAKCPKDSACQSGNCVKGACCSTTCGANFTCETGNCQCNGVTCAGGASCVTYYADNDGDGYGDPNLPAFGCTSPAPAKFVLNSNDCDDGDANAFPGQTKFFDVPRKGKGGYDYDCNNALAYKYPTVSSASGACKLCNPVNPAACGITNCESRAAFACAAIIGCPYDKDGFYNNPGCGNPGDLKTCHANIPCDNGFVGSTPNVKQACH